VVRIGGIALLACLVVALTGCIPNAGPAPTSDPFQGPMFAAINRDRAENGLPALEFSPKLATLAGSHSCDMANSSTLGHSDLQALLGSSDYAGFDVLRENVIVAPPGSTPDQLEATWMGSSLHRANILATDVHVVGMNECMSSDGLIWATEDFGGL
jgi:uncharacterized protein YkwD